MWRNRENWALVAAIAAVVLTVLTIVLVPLLSNHFGRNNNMETRNKINNSAWVWMSIAVMFAILGLLFGIYCGPRYPSRERRLKRTLPIVVGAVYISLGSCFLVLMLFVWAVETWFPW